MKKSSVAKNVILFIGLMIIVSADVFVQKLTSLDEMWIFNFARCICNGLLPYKDFSIIITPLFPMICAIFLKIFGDEMLVLRFLEVTQSAAILFMIFKVLRRLNVNKGVSLIAVLRTLLYVHRCISF